MPSAHAADLAFAVSLAQRAGAIISAGYQNVERIDPKGRRDVVTDVDYRSEAAVIQAIRDRFPDDAILADPEQSRAALQYSVSEGYLPLRRWIAQRMINFTHKSSHQTFSQNALIVSMHQVQPPLFKPRALNAGAQRKQEQEEKRSRFR